LDALIDAAVKRFTRTTDIEIAISRDDVSEVERFKYSYIVVVQPEEANAELS
jgi:hypothetical protein